MNLLHIPVQRLGNCGPQPFLSIKRPRSVPTAPGRTHDKLTFLGLGYPAIVLWYEVLDGRCDFLHPQIERTGASR